MPVTTLSISGLTLSLETPEELSVQPDFQDFLISEPQTPALHIRFTPVRFLPVPEGPLLADTGAFALYREENGFLRAYSTNSNVTALSRRTGEGAEVLYLENGCRCRTVRECFSIFPLEALLLSRGRMVLHASCVETEWGGILFSGPSGIGKSTQAELWRRFYGGKIINGDRVILHRDGKCWLASGSPYAGSSRIYVNRSVCVRAIVMLEQGRGNVLSALAAPEAFRQIYPQVLVNTWDPDFVSEVCDLCQVLISEVPVMRFSCTPDQAAVRAMEAWLKGGGSRAPEHCGIGTPADSIPHGQGQSGGHSCQRNL